MMGVGCHVRQATSADRSSIMREVVKTLKQVRLSKARKSSKIKALRPKVVGA